MLDHSRARLGACALGVAASLTFAAGASATAIKMPTLLKAIQHYKAHEARAGGAAAASGPGITPPHPPCPENGLLPSAAFSSCGVAEGAAIGVPFAGNMTYWGGPVQVHPHVYMVYWGWGESGAWPAGTSCASQTISEPGHPDATLACDPDGAGRYMADFVRQMGGTPWAGVSTQFFQTDASGNNQQQISNDPDVLAGIWVDDTNPGSLANTTLDNPPGKTNTLTLLGEEAQRAAEHFGVSGADLVNADFVIAQPPSFSDPNAASVGYCAFHDYTQKGIEGSVYDGVTPGLVYTNMPYVLANNVGSGSSATNVCGENAVNSDARGKLDGESIVLGHEIEEAVTDPGAEDVLGGSGLNNQTFLGGWYDPFDANENGDKCAWVGVDPLTGQGTVPIPGATANITGNGGARFAVQSLWSNNSAGGAGWCAGAGTDLPGPLAGGENGAIARSAAKHHRAKRRA